jgi:hypothetical protein
MTEQINNPTVTTPDVPTRSQPQFEEAMQTVFALMPLISFGLFLVLFGLLALMWPTGSFGEDSVESINNLERIYRGITGQYPTNVVKIILDIAYYPLVIAVTWFVVRAWIGAKRRVFVAIIAISILGMSYLAGMVLYNGPMVSACGFTVLLFGSFVILTVARDNYDSESDETSATQNRTESDSLATIETDKPADQPIDQPQSDELGTDKNA